MTKERTYAAEIDAKGDPEELAKARSLDAERAKAADPEQREEEDRAAALANAASQTGQT
jgi:hypothetical protein